MLFMLHMCRNATYCTFFVYIYKSLILNILLMLHYFPVLWHASKDTNVQFRTSTVKVINNKH